MPVRESGNLSVLTTQHTLDQPVSKRRFLACCPPRHPPPLFLLNAAVGVKIGGGGCKAALVRVCVLVMISQLIFVYYVCSGYGSLK
jgi:hypothetical protein